MRQLVRILLVSLSITAVESGILYFLLSEDQKKEPKVFLAEPLACNTAHPDNAVCFVKPKQLPKLNMYRGFVHPEQTASPVPRSDGRVYRR